MKIAKEVDDRAEEGKAYENLGNAYQCLSDYQKAIEGHEKQLEIALEIGDRDGESRAYGNLGKTCMLVGDYRKAIKYHEKYLKIAIEIGYREKEEPMEISVFLTGHLVTIEKPLTILKKN